jgi:magnesium transporter
VSLESRLAREFVRRHPTRSAGVLERLGAEEAAGMLSRCSAHEAAAVLRRMSPQVAAAALADLGEAKAADILETLPLDVAARLARRVDPELLAAGLERMDPRTGRSLRSLLRFAEDSAGALMDPNVLALPEDATAGEALDRIRSEPENARYNVYVVDRSQHLVGVVNLREILLARPRERLADFMVRNPKRLDANADRAAVVAHPGWREAHALPVVDSEGCYLGAIRYKILRALEEEFLGGEPQDADVREALGRLFATGAGGLLDALTSPGASKPGKR